MSSKALLRLAPIDVTKLLAVISERLPYDQDKYVLLSKMLEDVSNEKIMSLCYGDFLFLTILAEDHCDLQGDLASIMRSICQYGLNSDSNVLISSRPGKTVGFPPV